MVAVLLDIASDMGIMPSGLVANPGVIDSATADCHESFTEGVYATALVATASDRTAMVVSRFDMSLRVRRLRLWQVRFFKSARLDLIDRAAKAEETNLAAA